MIQIHRSTDGTVNTTMRELLAMVSPICEIANASIRAARLFPLVAELECSCGVHHRVMHWEVEAGDSDKSDHDWQDLKAKIKRVRPCE